MERKGYESVYEELKGRTGTDPEIEKELCRRIAEAEAVKSIVPELSRIDWILTWIFIVLGSGLPILYYALKLGISM